MALPQIPMFKQDGILKALEETVEIKIIDYKERIDIGTIPTNDTRR